MLIKEAVRQNCSKCGRYEKEISPEQHGCDRCKKPIEPYGNDERLDVRIFSNSDSTKIFYFCSWECVFKFLKKRPKCDHFLTLPYVCFDNKIKGRRAKDFFAAIKGVK